MIIRYNYKKTNWHTYIKSRIRLKSMNRFLWIIANITNIFNKALVKFFTQYITYEEFRLVYYLYRKYVVYGIGFCLDENRKKTFFTDWNLCNVHVNCTLCNEHTCKPEIVYTTVLYCTVLYCKLLVYLYNVSATRK